MSRTGIDERLARLAPTTPPDPAAHHAARAVLESALGSAAPSVTTGGSPHDGGRHLPDGHVTVEVAPPGRGHGRRRRAVYALAAATLVVAGVGAAVLVPRYVGPIGPASERRALDAAAERCIAHWDDGPTLAPVVSERRGASLLTFVAAGTTPDAAAFCDTTVDDPDSSGGNGWSDAAGPSATLDGVTVAGMADSAGQDAWAAQWGYAGDDVDTVTLTMPGDETVEATVRGGYWVAWWPSSEHGVDDVRRVAWTVDGRTSSATPDELAELRTSGGAS